MAEEIRNQHVTSINSPSITRVSYLPLGCDWISWFIKRHEELKSVVGR